MKKRKSGTETMQTCQTLQLPPCLSTLFFSLPLSLCLSPPLFSTLSLPFNLLSLSLFIPSLSLSLSVSLLLFFLLFLSLPLNLLSLSLSLSLSSLSPAKLSLLTPRYVGVCLYEMLIQGSWWQQAGLCWPAQKVRPPVEISPEGLQRAGSKTQTQPTRKGTQTTEARKTCCVCDQDGWCIRLGLLQAAFQRMKERRLLVT